MAHTGHKFAGPSPRESLPPHEEQKEGVQKSKADFLLTAVLVVIGDVLAGQGHAITLFVVRRQVAHLHHNNPRQLMGRNRVSRARSNVGEILSPSDGWKLC